MPHTARAAERLPATTLYNGYGPTECAVAATGFRIPHTVDPRAASIPIGPPIANTTAYVLDRHQEPVPVGVPGELTSAGRVWRAATSTGPRRRQSGSSPIRSRRRRARGSIARATSRAGGRTAPWNTWAASTPR